MARTLKIDMKKRASGVGQKLAQLRDSLGFTQDALAEKAKISRRTLQSIEYGQVTDPGVLTLAEILRVMGRSFADIGIDPGGQQVQKTVAEMTQDQLRGIVAKPSKKNKTINLEKERLQKKVDSIPEILFKLWPRLHPARQALCIYILNQDSRVLSALSSTLINKIQEMLESEELEARPPQK